MMEYGVIEELKHGNGNWKIRLWRECTLHCYIFPPRRMVVLGTADGFEKYKKNTDCEMTEMQKGSVVNVASRLLCFNSLQKLPFSAFWKSLKTHFIFFGNIKGKKVATEEDIVQVCTFIHFFLPMRIQLANHSYIVAREKLFFKRAWSRISTVLC